MAEVPLKLPTGRVVGKFIFEVQDNNDPGEAPQLVPVTGDIIIKSSIDNLSIFDESLGKFVTFRGPHKAIIDSDGELATPDPTTGEPMYTGMSLWSNDSDKLSVKGWTYTATFNLKTADGKTLNLPTATFTLATGQEVDLADVIRVPATPGYGLPQAEGAALRAEAAAQVALDVKAMADAGEFDGAQGLPGNATMRVDTSVGTRVFISDGTDERMVSSDTGWRDMSGRLLNGWTAHTVQIRRINNTVILRASNLNGTAASGDQPYRALNIGGGLSSGGAYFPFAISFAESGQAFADTQFNVATGRVYGSTRPAQITWVTDDPWPTSLPGTAA